MESQESIAWEQSLVQARCKLDARHAQCTPTDREQDNNTCICKHKEVYKVYEYTVLVHVYIRNVCTDLPSEVILMREISAGVPMKDPIPPAVTPAHTHTHTPQDIINTKKYYKCHHTINRASLCACVYVCRYQHYNNADT